MSYKKSDEDIIRKEVRAYVKKLTALTEATKVGESNFRLSDEGFKIYNYYVALKRDKDLYKFFDALSNDADFQHDGNISYSYMQEFGSTTLRKLVYNELVKKVK